MYKYTYVHVYMYMYSVYTLYIISFSPFFQVKIAEEEAQVHARKNLEAEEEIRRVRASAVKVRGAGGQGGGYGNLRSCMCIGKGGDNQTIL